MTEREIIARINKIATSLGVKSTTSLRKLNKKVAKAAGIALEVYSQHSDPIIVVNDELQLSCYHDPFTGLYTADGLEDLRDMKLKSLVNLAVAKYLVNHIDYQPAGKAAAFVIAEGKPELILRDTEEELRADINASYKPGTMMIFGKLEVLDGN